MAFLKKANAMVVHPRVTGSAWGGVRKVASSAAGNLNEQAHTILGGPLDPDRYLISHCTIVASVDTDTAPEGLGHKSGTVNRKYADYLIRPECSQFVNNNGDSWSRDVLKKSYRTFIGAHNFQEHVQIEDQSKGRIIDAVARDIGDSLYVDILVATDRKHAKLVQDIEMGKLATLSMGCTTDFTLCSKCGHYAEDETQLCDHIKYSKLNTFMDDEGKKRVIAELCGHKDHDDETGGVRFIEASWVAVPAFKGAVMRNILSPGEVSSEKLSDVISAPPPSWSEEAVLKAANLRSVRSFDFDEGGDEHPAAADGPPPPPFQAVEDALYDKIKTRVRERLEKEMRQEQSAQAVEGESMDPNDSLVKEGSYKASLDTMVRIASSPVALVEGIATTNLNHGIQVDKLAYRTALKAGYPERYGSPSSYLRACQKLAGRNLTPAEFRVVVRIGTLLSRWESINNPKI